MIFKF